MTSRELYQTASCERYKPVTDALHERLDNLKSEAGKPAPLWLTRELASLSEQYNELVRELSAASGQCNGLAAKHEKLDEREFGNIAECRHRIRQLLDCVGKLERERFELPLTSSEKRKFARELQKSRRSGRSRLLLRLWPRRHEDEILADMRYTGKWGLLGGESEKRSRRLIEINRFLTDRPHARERRYAVLAILVALVMGFAATVAAVLAVPAEKTGPLRCAIPIVARMLCAEVSSNGADIFD
jgi:hypothetical protein